MHAEAFWGPETAAALRNFGEGSTPAPFVRALAEVKLACLRAVQETERRWPDEVFAALEAACLEVAAGKYPERFRLPLMQGGAGTSLNMNMNEVLASLVGGLDPIEDINRYQSTNDVVPTAVTISLYRLLTEVEREVIELQEALVAWERQSENLLMEGRTEMQSALPMTLGQVFGAWAGATERDRWRLNKLKERIRTIPLGGTAIGTCFSAPQRYIYAAERALRSITGLPLCRSQNLPDEISNLDAWAELANGFALCAVNLFKMCGDLLLYTSSMVGEMEHPRLQAGSSIMAAKTNPVILEHVRGLAVHVQGEAWKVGQYAAAGQLQLNPFLPHTCAALLSAGEALQWAIAAFRTRFLDGLRVNAARMERNLAGSLAMMNALTPKLGYHRVKELYEKAPSPPASLEELAALVARETGTPLEEVRSWLSPGRLAGMSGGNA